MGKYSIKELERLSGIKAHTLRIWEKRFDLLKPKRTDTNIRYYADDDLKKILNVSLLCNSGEKISKIASLTDSEICAAVQKLEEGGFLLEKRLDDFVKAMLDLDEIAFNKIFDKVVKELGFQEALTKVVFPFLKKVGILWLSDEIQPIHEHFTTNLIRNKMIAAIDGLSAIEEGKKAVLFLPEDEFHELGLIFFNFLLKQRGIKTYYLGQTTPIAEVKAMVETVNADFVLTYTLVKSKKEIVEVLSQLEGFNDTVIYFLEHSTQNKYHLEYPKGVHKITKVDSLLKKEC